MSALFEAKSIDNLHRMAKRKIEYFDEAEQIIKEREFLPEYDAIFLDRDGQKYPAHLQHVSPTEPGHRVFLDAQERVVLFKAVDPDGKPDVWYRITTQPDHSQRQEKITVDEGLALAKNLSEYKCLTAMAAGGGFNTMLSTDEQYANQFKIPVIDMLVEFGNARTGSRINSVSNVRHARYAPGGLMSNRIPCYILKEENDPLALQRSAEAELLARAQKAEAELAALKAGGNVAVTTQSTSIEFSAGTPNVQNTTAAEPPLPPEPENPVQAPPPAETKKKAPRRKSS